MRLDFISTSPSASFLHPSRSPSLQFNDSTPASKQFTVAVTFDTAGSNLILLAVTSHDSAKFNRIVQPVARFGISKRNVSQMSMYTRSLPTKNKYVYKAIRSDQPVTNGVSKEDSRKEPSSKGEKEREPQEVVVCPLAQLVRAVEWGTQHETKVSEAPFRGGGSRPDY